MKYILTEKQYRLLSEQWWNDPKHPEYKKFAPSDYEKREIEKTQQNLKSMAEISPHTLMTVAQIGTAFIPLIGPAISMGIGLADAALYLKEGDKKTAGLIGLFSMLPAVGGLASKMGLGKWSAKALGTIGEKISKGQKLSSLEVQAANKVAQYRHLIQTEMSKLGEQSTIQSGKNAAKKQITKSSIIKGTKKVGTQLVGNAGVGYVYDKGYDKLNGQQGPNLTSIDVNKISQANKKAALSIKFD